MVSKFSGQRKALPLPKVKSAASGVGSATKAGEGLV
jgi:hypothetical protein